jgi:hypothetical protein
MYCNRLRGVGHKGLALCGLVLLTALRRIRGSVVSWHEDRALVSRLPDVCDHTQGIRSLSGTSCRAPVHKCEGRDGQWVRVGVLAVLVSIVEVSVAVVEVSVLPVAQRLVRPRRVRGKV